MSEGLDKTIIDKIDEKFDNIAKQEANIKVDKSIDELMNKFNEKFTTMEDKFTSIIEAKDKEYKEALAKKDEEMDAKIKEAENNYNAKLDAVPDRKSISSDNIPETPKGKEAIVERYRKDPAFRDAVDKEYFDHILNK